MATTLSPEDAAQLRTYERDRHNALAEGYIGFFSPVTALAIAPLLEAVRLAPGMKLLDVPTGSGALAAEATRRGASVVALVAPALLGALVVYETVSAGAQGIELDARLAGLAAAAVALALRLPLIAVVLVAALATALTRLI